MPAPIRQPPPPSYWDGVRERLTRLAGVLPPLVPFVGNPFDPQLQQPQQVDETNLGYGARRLLTAPGRGAANFGGAGAADLAKLWNYATATPSSTAAATTAPAQAQQMYDTMQGMAGRIFGGHGGAPTPSAVPPPILGGASPFNNSNLTIVRNNNPGALMGPDGHTPLHFGSLQEGIAAQEALLHRRYFNKGLNTVSSIVDTYSPLGPNTAEQVAGYKNYVAKRLGVDPNAPLDPANVPQLAAAMREFETGSHRGGYSASGVSSGGLQAPFTNPFDPTYGNAAIGELNKGEAAASLPQSFTLDRPQAPTMPAPTPIPETDFSKADAALQQTAPVAMTDKEKLAIQRTGWFRGLGQALMSLPENAGVGKIFAAVGGATLAGRAAADTEIRAKTDKFDEEMMRFHQAVYANNMTEAEVHGKEAASNVQQMNQYALGKWQTEYNAWSKDNQVDVNGDSIISRKANPDGSETVTRTPIKAAVAAGFALHRATVYSSMMGVQNQGNGLVASANNALVANEAAAQAAQARAAGDPNGQAAALVTAPAMAATAVVENGRAIDVLGGEQPYSQLRAHIDGSMKMDGWSPPLPGDAKYAADYRAEFNKRLGEEMTRGALADKTGQFTRRLFGAATPGLIMQRANQTSKQSTTTRVDAKGRTSTSQTTSGDALE